MNELDKITGKQVLDEYCSRESESMIKDDYAHFSGAFDRWLTDIRNGIGDYSLNSKNYLGKKTRALLSVLGIKEPKNKKELTKIINKFI